MASPLNTCAVQKRRLRKVRSNWAGLGLGVGLCCAALFCRPLPAAAMDVEQQSASLPPWQITADRIISFQESQKVEAAGAVELERPGLPGKDPLQLNADQVIYDGKTGQVNALGSVRINTGGDRAEADSAAIDINGQTATFTSTRMFFAASELYFSGNKVEKTGPQTYSFEDGSVTACLAEGNRSPAWSIHCSKARVTIDGFAVLKHATLRVKDFPVAYTPLLIFPAKTKRETGFLFPEISHSSRDGTGFLLPFFVNISPSSDMTLYPGYLQRRGFYGGVEMRHVAADRSWGTLAVNYLDDSTEDTEAGVKDLDYLLDGFLRTTHDRYWVRGKVDHYFSDSSALRMDIDFTSDPDFIHEYREGMIGFDQSNRNFLSSFHRGFQEGSISFRESTMQASKGWSQTYLGGETRYVDDKNDNSETTTPIQTLPRLLMTSRLALFDTPMGLGWKSEYVNYWRSEGLGYERLDLFPVLAAPVPLGRLVEGKVSAGFRETIYQAKYHGEHSGDPWPDSQNRNLVDLAANIAAPLTRDFEFGGDTERWLNHTIRPNLKYSYIYSKTQKEFPDLDSDDRLGLANLVTYEWNNYFILGKFDEKGVESSRDLGHVNVSQGYNITKSRRDLVSVTDKRRPFSEISFDLDLYPVPALQLRYLTGLSVYGEGVTRYDLLARYTDSRKDSLAVDYVYTKGGTTDLRIDLEAVLSQQIKVKYHTTQSLTTNHKTLESLGVIFTPHCWALEVEVSKDSEDQRIMAIISLTGIGKAFDWGKSNI